MQAVCPCRKRYLARAELAAAPLDTLQPGLDGHAISFFHLREFVRMVCERRDSIGKRAPAHPVRGDTLRPCSAQSGTRRLLLSFYLAFPGQLPAGSAPETPGRPLKDLLRKHSVGAFALRPQSCVLNAPEARLHRTRWVLPAAPRLWHGGWHLPFRSVVLCDGKNVPIPPSNARVGCWPQSPFCTLLPRPYCPAFPAHARKCSWPAPCHARQHSLLVVWLCSCRRPKSPELPGNTRSGQSAPADCLHPALRLVRTRFLLCAPAQKP